MLNNQSCRMKPGMRIPCQNSIKYKVRVNINRVGLSIYIYIYPSIYQSTHLYNYTLLSLYTQTNLSNFPYNAYIYLIHIYNVYIYPLLTNHVKQIVLAIFELKFSLIDKFKIIFYQC